MNAFWIALTAKNQLRDGKFFDAINTLSNDKDGHFLHIIYLIKDYKVIEAYEKLGEIVVRIQNEGNKD